jgi:hypothetical protein
MRSDNLGESAPWWGALGNGLGDGEGGNATGDGDGSPWGADGGMRPKAGGTDLWNGDGPS